MMRNSVIKQSNMICYQPNSSDVALMHCGWCDVIIIIIQV